MEKKSLKKILTAPTLGRVQPRTRSLGSPPSLPAAQRHSPVSGSQTAPSPHTTFSHTFEAKGLAVAVFEIGGGRLPLPSLLTAGAVAASASASSAQTQRTQHSSPAGWARSCRGIESSRSGRYSQNTIGLVSQ